MFAMLMLPRLAHADGGVIAGSGCVVGGNPAVETTFYPDFEAWLGRDLPRIHTYLMSSPPNWMALENDYTNNAIPCLSLWAAQGKEINISVPMLVWGTTLLQGAQGDFDAEFVKLGTALVAAGLEKATLRIGWEFNGTWFFWAAKNDPADFIIYWRRIIADFRSVKGQEFKFDWCSTWGSGAFQADEAYPGDDVVDYIGMDVYDSTFGGYQNTPQQRWNYITNTGHGLNWLVKFAALHHKLITIPEWGTTSGPNGAGGVMYPGDDPYYFEQMAAFFHDNKVAYQFLYDSDGTPGNYFINLANFPNSAEQYRQSFGVVTPVNQNLVPPENTPQFAQ